MPHQTPGLYQNRLHARNYAIAEQGTLYRIVVGVSLAVAYPVEGFQPGEKVSAYLVHQHGPLAGDEQDFPGWAVESAVVGRADSEVGHSVDRLHPDLLAEQACLLNPGEHGRFGHCATGGGHGLLMPGR
jgi:hypothetical protein